MEELKTVVIGLGSNLGNRRGHLETAISRMQVRVGELLRMSSVQQTEAWGFSAPPFLNQIVVMRTALPPLALLDELQAIEQELGRTEKTVIVDGRPVYHSRTIDLDILDYDGERYADDRLTLPHPRIHQRDFVLRQLDELGIVL